MIESTTEFNAVYVIESLRETETRTGRNLYEGVLTEHAAKSEWLEVDYRAARNRRSFFDALDWVLDRVRSDRLPILHIESHGNSRGIRLADDDLVQWREIREVLTKINRATKCRLLVVMAMCKGAYLAKELVPPNPAPAWAVIGARVDVDDLPMEEGMWLQYDALLSGKGGNTSLAALNTVQADPAQRYSILSAEEMFHDVLWNFFRNRTQQIVKEHEELIVADVAQRWGDVPFAPEKAREIAARRLSDERYWYQCFRQQFLMLDEFPENSARFVLSFDDYKQQRALIARPVKGETTSPAV